MTRPNLFAGLRNSYLASTKSEYTDRFFVSWLLPRWLVFALRTVIAIYMFTVQFFILGYDSTHGHDRAAREDFAYFTVLTYWGMAFYFAFSAAHTASYAVRGEAWLSNWPRVLRWLHSVLYATVTIYPFIVTGELRKDNQYSDHREHFTDDPALKLFSGPRWLRGLSIRHLRRGQISRSTR